MLSEKKRIYICDFSRGRLNVRLPARIQPLLRGHKYRFFSSLRAVFGWTELETTAQLKRFSSRYIFFQIYTLLRNQRQLTILRYKDFSQHLIRLEVIMKNFQPLQYAISLQQPKTAPQKRAEPRVVALERGLNVSVEANIQSSL